MFYLSFVLVNYLQLLIEQEHYLYQHRELKCHERYMIYMFNIFYYVFSFRCAEIGLFALQDDNGIVDSLFNSGYESHSILSFPKRSTTH